MTTTTTETRKPLMSIPEIKEMIRSVVSHKGLDAFFDDEDVRYEIGQVIEVKYDDIPADDIQRVRDQVNRARVTVTFGRGR